MRKDGPVSTVRGDLALARRDGLEPWLVVRKKLN